MTPGRPRAGWKAWEPAEGSDAFYVGQDLPRPEPQEPKQ